MYGLLLFFLCFLNTHDLCKNNPSFSWESLNFPLQLTFSLPIYFCLYFFLHCFNQNFCIVLHGSFGCILANSISRNDSIFIFQCFLQLVRICCVAINEFEENRVECDFGRVSYETMNKVLLDCEGYNALANVTVEANEQDVLSILHE